jgi:hypothetical protein
VVVDEVMCGWKFSFIRLNLSAALPRRNVGFEATIDSAYSTRVNMTLPYVLGTSYVVAGFGAKRIEIEPNTMIHDSRFFLKS